MYPFLARSDFQRPCLEIRRSFIPLAAAAEAHPARKLCGENCNHPAAKGCM